MRPCTWNEKPSLFKMLFWGWHTFLLFRACNTCLAPWRPPDISGETSCSAAQTGARRSAQSAVALSGGFSAFSFRHVRLFAQSCHLGCLSQFQSSTQSRDARGLLEIGLPASKSHSTSGLRLLLVTRLTMGDWRKTMNNFIWAQFWGSSNKTEVTDLIISQSMQPKLPWKSVPH